MTEPSEIRVTQGRLQGERIDGVARFLGIPYAASPTGPRRWAAPEPAAPWTGVRAATAFGPDSLQPPNPWPWPSRASRMDEDCLYLNVWSPMLDRGAPVLVVIHGGGFQLLSGAYPEFDGATLARDGVVVVTFNYRLGVLGFAGASNWLLDQIEALRWVHANIAAFGGDPGQVTIMGVSAGGVSVNALNTAPRARGLFRQAICVSGAGDTLFSTGPHRGRPQPQADGQPPVHSAAFEGGAGEFAVVDGDLIPTLPSAALHQGRSNATRLVIAFSDYESLIVDDLNLAEADLAAALLPAAPAHECRPLTPDGHTLYDHLIFRAPALALADLAAGAGVETYVLDFDYVSSPLRGHIRGAAHGAAMYAFLGTADPNYAARDVTPDQDERNVGRALRSRLVAFLAGDAPQVVGHPKWPRHAEGGADALIVEADGYERIGRPPGLQDLAARTAPAAAQSGMREKTRPPGIPPVTPQEGSTV